MALRYLTSIHGESANSMNWGRSSLQIRLQAQLQSRASRCVKRRSAHVLWFSIALAAAAWPPSAAFAADDWHFQIAGTTDRINRGLDKSDKGPSVDVAASWYPGTGPFAGVSVSTVKLFHGAPVGAEIIGDAGYRWRRGDWSTQAMVLHYQFAHTPGATRAEYDEIGLAGAWRESVFASVTASPNTSYGGPRTLALTYNLVGHWPLAHGFSAIGGVGYYDLHAEFGAGFFYDDIGLDYQYGPLQLQLAYFGTQSPARIKARLGPMLVHRWVMQLSWAF